MGLPVHTWSAFLAEKVGIQIDIADLAHGADSIRSTFPHVQGFTGAERSARMGRYRVFRLKQF